MFKQSVELTARAANNLTETVQPLKELRRKRKLSYPFQKMKDFKEFEKEAKHTQQSLLPNQSPWRGGSGFGDSVPSLCILGTKLWKGFPSHFHEDIDGPPPS